MDSLQLDTKALVTHLGQDFLIEVVRKRTAISHRQMRNAFTGIIFPCLQTANLTLNLRNHTSQLVTCLESVLEGIRFGAWRVLRQTLLIVVDPKDNGITL